jgi:hypothetical protein
MSIAIQTKFIPPTNAKDSRVSAKAEGGRSVIITNDNSLNPEQNHLAAARAFIKKYDYGVGQSFTLVNGGSVDGKGFVFIPVFKWTNRYKGK